MRQIGKYWRRGTMKVMGLVGLPTQNKTIIWTNTFCYSDNFFLDKTRQIHLENETNWKVLKEWHNESDGLGALANWLHSKLRILRRLLLSKEEKTSAVVAPQIVIENFLAAKKQDLKVMKSVIPQFLWFPHRRFLLSVFGTAKISQLCVLIPQCLEQARKSSEDAQAARYARFENVWAG